MLRECPIDHRCMTGVSVDEVSRVSLERLGDVTGPAGRVDYDLPHQEQNPRTNPLDGVTVFLDRDGTLNEDPGYLGSAAELKLLPGVGAALARLKAAGARLVVVTNQSGIARGLFTLKDLEAIHARLEGLLERDDAALDAIYFCPHHPDDRCRCRKPARGMVDRAVAELQVDLRRSYLVGDHAKDIRLAKSVGARAILLTSGTVDEQALTILRAAEAMPDVCAQSMAEAVDWILKDVTTKGSFQATSASSSER